MQGHPPKHNEAFLIDIASIEQIGPQEGHTDISPPTENLLLNRTTCLVVQRDKGRPLQSRTTYLPLNEEIVCSC